MKTLKANLSLSATVALIGVSASIALSFALRGLLDATPLQCFAAGAALCSTSLGTTFTVLATSGLTESRLGVVLTSAAMMDDVVGLIMVRVISGLGNSSSFDAITVVRPICVSIAFVVIIPLLCCWVVKPLTVIYHKRALSRHTRKTRQYITSASAAFVMNTAVLLVLVTGSSYAGTSNLLAAYLAGASISWWDGLRSTLGIEQDSHAATSEEVGDTALHGRAVSHGHQQTSTVQDVRENLGNVAPTGLATYERYYGAAVQVILKPFFFASIGFSIPISRMFSGSVVWRGLVYAVLVAMGKLLCGLCLVRFSSLFGTELQIRKMFASLFKGARGARRTESTAAKATDHDLSHRPGTPQADQADNTCSGPQTSENDARNREGKSQAEVSRKRTKMPKPYSLYPGAILGSAMVVRGEIGFLISSVAESNGVYTGEAGSAGSELFLVVTWAILLCTILGPVSVGLLVKRTRRLQELERSKSTGREDPLGLWGVVQIL